MDEPESTQSAGDYADGDEPVVPPIHVLSPKHEYNPHQASQDENESNDEENNPQHLLATPEAPPSSSQEPQYVARKSNWMERYIRFERIGWDRAAELVFAAGIVLFSLLQYLSSRSTSDQIQAIVDSANQIKTAAWVFSGAAQGVNNIGWSAVAKLDRSATALEQTSSVTKLSLAVQAQGTEPYLEFGDSWKMTEGPPYMYPGAAQSPLTATLKGLVRNTGGGEVTRYLFELINETQDTEFNDVKISLACRRTLQKIVGRKGPSILSGLISTAPIPIAAKGWASPPGLSHLYGCFAYQGRHDQPIHYIALSSDGKNVWILGSGSKQNNN